MTFKYYLCIEFRFSSMYRTVLLMYSWFVVMQMQWCTLPRVLLVSRVICFLLRLPANQGLKVAFQNGLRLTVDFRRKSWVWFQKLTDFDSCIIFQKIATVATSWLSTFRGFCCGFFHRISVGKWKNSYKMASKSSKNSVEVNSRLRGRSS
jgi:hypothetical protein